MSLNFTTLNVTASQRELKGTLQAEDKMRTSDIVIIAIVLVVIFIISLAGNTFVFLVFYKRPALVTISNRFIVNLSVCNILETIFVMPFVFLALISQSWYFGSFLCQVTGFLMNAIFAASTLTLVVIAIDRYCAIITPLHYSMMITSRRASGMIVMVWVLAVCCSIPPLVGWNRYEYQRKKSVCTAVSKSQQFNDRSFTIFLVMLCFVVPLVIILWAYCVIFKAARNSSEKVRRNSTLTNLTDEFIQTPLRNSRRSSTAPILSHRLSVSSRGNSQIWKRDEWKAAVTSCMVVFTFIICWLLYFIIIILECLVEDPDSIESVIKTISILLAMSSCAFNPLVYVFRGKIQRVELKAILGLKTKCTSFANFPNNSHFTSGISRSPCISRQGSEESDIIIQKLHHVTTATTLTSMVVAEEQEIRDFSRT